MEVQLTDFENAAFTVFVTLVLRVMLSFDLDVYMPISQVAENMEAARARDAVTDAEFHWRSHLVSPKNKECVKGGKGCTVHADRRRVEKMSCLEILTGKGSYYPGLVPLVLVYLESIGCDPETERLVRSYLDLIVKRASGELQTPAKWMRGFVQQHPEYKGDSKVPPAVAFDLLQACHDVGIGKLQVPQLLGQQLIAPIMKENAYNVQLLRVSLDSDEALCTILQRYSERAKRVRHRERLQKQLLEKRADLQDLEHELAALDLELEPRSLATSNSSQDFFQRTRTDSHTFQVATNGCPQNNV